MVKILSKTEVLTTLCKSTGKWGMFVCIASSSSFQEAIKAAPYLEGKVQILMEQQAFILADSEGELNGLYEQTVGDDGPTKTNPYSGSARVYALTCNPEGQLLRENT